MVIYLYRWKIIPEKEDQFIEAWSFVTQELRGKSQSLGSRLHRGEDGLWYGYAQWPSKEIRKSSNLTDESIQKARVMMRDATIEMLPEIILNPISDFLIIENKSCK